MRVLVCGGRIFGHQPHELRLIMRTLDALEGVTELIEGGATGADRYARNWAKARGVPVRTFEADWVHNGRAAGPIRNRQMLREGKPDLVIAFAGGRGTADLCDQARRAGVEVREIKG